ncbi:preprotein translocase subunit SecG [Brytella acorum]|uniref:Protein-export membrane protein SecG n=1 Tax=Brytella acorum TaxID=2959299 RepID=A0AA35V6W9_9PROT|nr:preprotein translocase subunit SecG [Brytella acorum]MDF3623902.1 preprotein translocase subunit SecG [Brytella acorum]CAI9120818.1 preprotein translocase subunit SecG [Brytella acorum]
MTTFLLVLNLFVTVALIATVLIQRSEGGGLGIGSSQGMGSFMTGRGTATLLTRATSILAAIFMVLCLMLAVLNRGASSGVGGKDILAQPATSTTTTTPAPTPAPAGK